MLENGRGVDRELTIPKFSKSGSFIVNTRQNIAKESIGKERYWGVEEWIEYFNYPFTDEQLLAIDRIPWSSVELESVRNSHFLHLGVPPPSPQHRQLTISAWQKMPGVSPISISDQIKNIAAVVEETLLLRWYLTSLKSIRASANLPYSQQLALLHSNEESPGAIEVVQALLLYEKLNLKRANPECYLRTRNATPDKRVISVGYLSTFDSGECVNGPLRVICVSQSLAWIGGGIGSSIKLLNQSCVDGNRK